MNDTEKRKENAPKQGKSEKKKIDKENVKKLTDEELNKVAGGHECPPECQVIDLWCTCDDSW